MSGELLAEQVSVKVSWAVARCAGVEICPEDYFFRRIQVHAEESGSPEVLCAGLSSLFVYAIDKIEPPLLILFESGSGASEEQLTTIRRFLSDGDSIVPALCGERGIRPLETMKVPEPCKRPDYKLRCAGDLLEIVFDDYGIAIAGQTDGFGESAVLEFIVEMYGGIASEFPDADESARCEFIVEFKRGKIAYLLGVRSQRRLGWLGFLEDYGLQAVRKGHYSVYGRCKGSDEEGVITTGIASDDGR